MLPRMLIILGLLAALAVGIKLFTGAAAPQAAPALSAGPAASDHAAAPHGATGGSVAEPAIPANSAQPEPTEPLEPPLKPEDVLEFDVAPDGSLRPRPI
jgi:hypothetical protein